MRKVIIVLLPLLAFVACSTAPNNGIKYENILIALPIPEAGWIFRASKDHEDDALTWSKGRERFQVNVLRRREKKSPYSFRTGIDNATREHLTSSFETVELNSGVVNNYPMIMWETKAVLNDGTKTMNLFLYIKGNDACYWIHKRWVNQEVSSTTRQLWLDYLSTISVCDTRRAEHACPPASQKTRSINYFDLTNSVIENWK